MLTNSGNDRFVVVQTLPTGFRPASIATADLNADGFMDIVAPSAAGHELSVWTSNGSGQFSLTTSPTSGLFPQSVLATDVNGDGKPDLISADSGDDTVTILLNSRH